MSVSFKRGWAMSSDHLAQLEPMRKSLPREASRGHEGESEPVNDFETPTVSIY